MLQALKPLLKSKDVVRATKALAGALDAASVVAWLQRLASSRNLPDGDRIARATDGWLTARGVQALLPYTPTLLRILDRATDAWVEYAASTDNPADDAVARLIDGLVDDAIELLAPDAEATPKVKGRRAKAADARAEADG